MLLKFPWVRLTLAGILLIGTCSYAARATSDKMQVGPAFAAIICLLSACILLATIFRRHAAKPFTSLIDRIYFGDDYQDENPKLNLRLPRAYRAEKCYEKSILECGRQMEWHSLSPELWAELLLAHRGTGNPEADAATRQQALICLGMTDNAARFDRLVQDRDNLPVFPAGYVSQFERTA